MRTRTAFGALIPGLALTLAATLGLSGTAGAAANDRGAQQPSSAAARQALADARDALSGKAGRSTRDATLALRDLHRVLPSLGAADRRAAESILSRPTDPGDNDQYSVASETLCGTSVCLHWVESSGDAVALTDTSPANGTPDYVDLVLQTMDGVHSTYVGAGYKPPKADGGLGGNAMIDVYLANIGPEGLYGYCASDEPVVNNQYDYWTYCVLDNDYSPSEFGSNTPTENMQVTAAHEYFHAVQGAYDWWEDAWLMEATATWAEDELFDDVDDNVFYLPAGQLGVPNAPLDGFFNTGNSYGNWIFFRWLTEQIPAESGGMPILVRQIWANADSTNGAANDQYSLQAVSNALSSAGYPFPAAYADFATVNRQPRAFYDEGAANGYPTPPLAFKPIVLTPAKPQTTWGSINQYHLTNDTARFVPSKKMKTKSWKLKVQVDMAPRSRGSAAVVTVFYKGGKTGIKPIGLDSQGDGSVKVPFSSSDVSKVELTLINASQRTTCWAAGPNDPWYSCLGVPQDDNLKQKLRGVASR